MTSNKHLSTCIVESSASPKLVSLPQVSHESGSDQTKYEMHDLIPVSTANSDTTGQITIHHNETPEERLVDIATLKYSDKFQARSGVNESVVTKYCLTPVGNFPPILIAKSGDPELDGVVLGGIHRINAATKRKNTQIMAKFIWVENETQAQLEALKDNLHGKNLSRDELKKVCRSLHVTHGMTLEEIGTLIGRHKSSISRMLAEENKKPATTKGDNIKAVKKIMATLIAKLEECLSETTEHDPYWQHLTETLQALKKYQSDSADKNQATLSENTDAYPEATGELSS